MTRPDQTYLAKLLLYYEEEIEGEAYFDALARRFPDPAQHKRLMLLAEVERHAARGVAPLIAHYDLTPRSVESLTMSGHEQARRAPGTWAGLLDEMNRTYPAYLAAFEALEAMGPEADQTRLRFLTEHEVAALDYLALENAGAAQSYAPLVRYLASAPVPA
ncbi:hypothetical protein [Roseovarius sp. 217]|uniref:hypothetical protein n=1 Tax=Roseovarius sp. (strain 217) TaxID=314264 RepID=UPI0000685B66|nr:hypothetical protein [Roseovarius sp. 217]EAQ27427.1 hypothetical protein ROS217_22912 [Roseovarius sp. 217]